MSILDIVNRKNWRLYQVFITSVVNTSLLVGLYTLGVITVKIEILSNNNSIITLIVCLCSMILLSNSIINIYTYEIGCGRYTLLRLSKARIYMYLIYIHIYSFLLLVICIYIFNYVVNYNNNILYIEIMLLYLSYSMISIFTIYIYNIVNNYIIIYIYTIPILIIYIIAQSVISYADNSYYIVIILVLIALLLTIALCYLFKITNFKIK